MLACTKPPPPGGVGGPYVEMGEHTKLYPFGSMLTWLIMLSRSMRSLMMSSRSAAISCSVMSVKLLDRGGSEWSIPEAGTDGECVADEGLEEGLE